MLKIKEESGITILMLVIVIIALTIITSIVIRYSINGMDYSKQKKLLSDLEVVQHAVYENYEQYKITGDKELLIGTPANSTEKDTLTINSWEIKTSSNPEEIYYKLTPNDLKKLGIDNAKDEYIINYKTGECYNLTQKIITIDENKHELYIK